MDALSNPDDLDRLKIALGISRQVDLLKLILFLGVWLLLI